MVVFFLPSCDNFAASEFDDLSSTIDEKWFRDAVLWCFVLGSKDSLLCIFKQSSNSPFANFKWIPGKRVCICRRSAKQEQHGVLVEKSMTSPRISPCAVSRIKAMPLLSWNSPQRSRPICELIGVAKARSHGGGDVWPTRMPFSRSNVPRSGCPFPVRSHSP